MNPYEDDAPTNVQGTPPSQSGNQDQKSAITAAVVGTAALGGAAYGMSRFLDDEALPEEHSTLPNELSDTLPESETTTQQTTVDSQTTTETTTNTGTGQGTGQGDGEPHKQTFDEAFAEARAGHGGGGGYFEFDRDGDGKTEYYSTYLDSEWNHLSHQEKQEFYATVPDYHAPSGSGTTSDLPQPTTAVAHNDVPPPVDETYIDDGGEITVEQEPENSHVAPVSATDVEQKVDVARADLDGQEILVIDIDHDDHPDAIMNPDTHVALIDTDQDHILDTRAEYDEDGNVMHVEHIEENITITGSMEVLHESEQQMVQMEEDNSYLADDSDFGSDFDNNADTSDFDHAV
ncbi:hypothetical protein DYU11_09120 [Fibrisoma montanum]|uniref:Uncharacterized protein n=1 Tax=Fibrisoma montanum TaxID=2305895 RepID=A0A418MF68_9BACT|nr:hypothetical protein [Fibrisoma montanum]RIV25448.1 hypothetical protein DYU11_09120 [Fibrisoma montanum]